MKKVSLPLFLLNLMKRFEDKTYNVSNALLLGLNVKCPKCHGFGVVTADKTTAFLRVQLVGMYKKRTCYLFL